MKIETYIYDILFVITFFQSCKLLDLIRA
jgi:hypothetical protein